MPAYYNCKLCRAAILKIIFMINRFFILLILIFFYGLRIAEANLIPCSGFDTGVYQLWRSAYQEGRLVDDSDLDREVKHDGLYSLRLTLWEGNMPGNGYKLTTESVFKVHLSDKKSLYHFSAWIKSDEPASVRITLGSLEIKSRIIPKDGWKRISARGTLQRGDYTITIQASGNEYDPKTLHAGHVWLDSLQLEEGIKISDWKPSEPDIGLVGQRTANIYYDDEPVKIAMHAFNPLSERIELLVKVSLLDWLGNQLAVKPSVIEKTLAPGAAWEHVFSLPQERKGPFRLQILAKDQSGKSRLKDGYRVELPFYVIPRPDPDGWNPVGLYLQTTVPGMERASLLGLYWNNTLSASGYMTEWHKVFSKDGKFLGKSYFARTKAGVQKYKLRYVGTIGNSHFPVNFPAYAESSTQNPNQTAAFEIKNKSMRYLSLPAYREFLVTLYNNYKPYIRHWQIIDEVPFSGMNYLPLMVEAAKALKPLDSKVQILATYPQNMAYTYVRAGEEFVDGLYGISRNPEAARYYVMTAEIASDDYPIYFYDCSIPFNYLSPHLNGWGKLAYRAPKTGSPKEMKKYIEDFKSRFIKAFNRNIYPLGEGGKHAAALFLYHARLPGGQSNSAFDTYGHPAPLLMAFSVFNTLAGKGHSIGQLDVKGFEAYAFSRGEQNGFLVALKCIDKKYCPSIPVKPGLSIEQLDIWSNRITKHNGQKLMIVPDSGFWTYILVPPGKLEAVIRGLKFENFFF